MSNPTFTPAIAVLSLVCATAAWSDLKYRRIPNWLCAVTAVAGLTVTFWFGGLSVLCSHTLHMLAALVGGIILFRFGLFGGGDAKFYAAVAAWFPLAKGVLLLIAVALSGLVLLFVWFGYRRLAGYPVRVKGGTGFDALPYGIAIGIGAVAAMLL